MYLGLKSVCYTSINRMTKGVHEAGSVDVLKRAEFLRDQR